MFESVSRRSLLKSASALGLAGALAPMAALAAEPSAKVDKAASAKADATETPTEVQVASWDGEGNAVEVTVAFDPQRIVTLDMACLDILDSLGEAGRVVGSSSTRLDYLVDIVEAEGVEGCGTVKEADMEAIMACEPDVIFTGGRMSKVYADLTEIAPTCLMKTDTEKGVVQSTHDMAAAIAALFGKQDDVDELMADFGERIAKLAEFAKGHTAMLGMVTSGSFNVMGNDGRCSLITREVGFENVAGDEVTSTHGNESSFETVVSLDPEYIFVLDRDAAIGTDGAQLAQDVMNNEMVNQTQAAQNGHIVYLANPAVWYTAEGGVRALDMMLADLEDALLA